MNINEIINPAMYDPLVKWFANLIGADFSAMALPFWAILIRLLCAFSVGAILGAERATKSHAAGLRTYTLVALGSCICMLTNLLLFEKSDVARIPAGVLTGIGFIGAGTIITTSRHKIRGLTTAAALWTSGCVGLAFGAGLYTIGLIATILMIVTIMFLPKIESRLQKNVRIFDIHVEMMARKDLKELLDYLRSQDITIQSIDYDPAYANSGLSVYSLSLYSGGKNYLKEDEIIAKINELEYVNFCESSLGYNK